MLTNATLTIFNKFPDRDSNKFVFAPCFVGDVWFHTSQKSTVDENGLRSADEYKIRIPWPCEGWIPPQDYKDLENPEGNWTVQNGDLFLVGEWEGGKVSGISELRKSYKGIVGTVLSHSENFFGGSKHIRIGGGS